MKRLLPYLRPYFVPIAITLGLIFVQVIAELFLPRLMVTIVDEGVAYGDTALIMRTGGRMLLFAFTGIIAAVIGTYFASRSSAGFGRDLRAALFSHVTNFSSQEFDQLGTSTLITRTTNDVQQVEHVVYMFQRLITRAPLMAVGGIIMAVAQDARLSLFLIAAIPFLAFGIWLIFSKGMPLFKVVQQKLDNLNLVSRENLTGIRVIRAFNRTDYEQNRFTEANESLTDTAIRVNRLMAFMWPFMGLTLNVSTVAILWFGGLRVDQGLLQVGSLMAFIQYVIQIMWALMMISMIFVMIPRAQVSANRIAEVLATEPVIVDPPAPVSLAGSAGVVEFHDVTFHYPGAENAALQNVSFTAKPGEVTAFIGSIGSGKSTIARLLLRFYDTTSGAIRVNGVDIKQLSQHDLRAMIGYVPQQALLFSGSVADNLRYGKDDASAAELQHAASIARADDFVADLDGGFDAFIAQGGTNLSGGQRQRLTIARALVRRPRIYVFDDNFSALDFKTDAQVRLALRKETTDATVMIVAQRISTIMDADRIIVLDEGRVVGQGTHQQLVRDNDVYREIVASQLAEEAIA